MSGSTSKPSKASTLARVLALIAGTQKHLPNAQFTIGNASYTAASLVTLLQSLATALNAVNAAHASVKDALAALAAAKAQVLPVMNGYRRIVLAMFTSATQTLADFGLEPPKARAPRTGEQNAAAAAKAKATRTARGTKSTKQKLAIKGDVTGVTVIPVTTAAASSPSTQPASATPGAPIAPKS